MNKIYSFLLATPLLFVNFISIGQTNRAVTVLFHETFEKNSSTLSSWTTTPSSNCTAYNWTIQNNSGKGALGSAGYWLYQSSAAAAGCYAAAITPLFAVPKVDDNDTITIDFYVYRTATASTDYVSVAILNEYNNAAYGPFAAFASDAKNPPSAVGWYHFIWKINYNDNIYNNVTTQGFKVSFTGVSSNGVDLLLDEVTISHSYTHSAGISPQGNNDNYFSIYPNPAHNGMNLHFSDVLSDNTILNLYDMSGKQILNKSIPAGTSETSLDIHDLVNGIYIMEIKNNLSVIRKEVLIN